MRVPGDFVVVKFPQVGFHGRACVCALGGDWSLVDGEGSGKGFLQVRLDPTEDNLQTCILVVIIDLPPLG